MRSVSIFLIVGVILASAACVAVGSPASFVDARIEDTDGHAVNVSEDGALNVIVQDQHTEIVDLHLGVLVQVVTIASNTVFDALSITVTSAAPLTTGSMITIKEGIRFYQGEILGHTTNGAFFDVTLDTLLDFAFTTNAYADEQNINLAVNGNSTPVEFLISPANLSASIQWDITRIIFTITDGSAMDDGKFGGVNKLTKGIVVRVANDTTKNIFNAKSNGDMAAHMYDIRYSDKAPAGLFGFNARRTFAGQEKNGVTARLNASTSDSIEVIIQDDLTGLLTFHVIVQGHVTSLD